MVYLAEMSYPTSGRNFGNDAMRVAAKITLSKEEHRELERCASARSTSVRLRERGLVVEDGAEAEVGLQRAEHRLDIGKRDVGPPPGFLVLIGLIATQAVHARMDHHRAFDRRAGEAHCGGALAGLVSIEVDAVVLGDAPVFALMRPMRSRSLLARSRCGVAPVLGRVGSGRSRSERRSARRWRAAVRMPAPRTRHRRERTRLRRARLQPAGPVPTSGCCPLQNCPAPSVRRATD